MARSYGGRGTGSGSSSGKRQQQVLAAESAVPGAFRALSLSPCKVLARCGPSSGCSAESAVGWRRQVQSWRFWGFGQWCRITTSQGQSTPSIQMSPPQGPGENKSRTLSTASLAKFLLKLLHRVVMLSLFSLRPAKSLTGTETLACRVGRLECWCSQTPKRKNGLPPVCFWRSMQFTCILCHASNRGSLPTCS